MRCRSDPAVFTNVRNILEYQLGSSEIGSFSKTAGPAVPLSRSIVNVLSPLSRANRRRYPIA
jgi:hypothetical protein